MQTVKKREKITKSGKQFYCYCFEDNYKWCRCHLIEDLTGQTFEKLTVLSNTGRQQNKSYVWKCECNCIDQTICEVSARHLQSGHTTSCQCKNSSNLVGHIFGLLTVLEKTDKRSSDGSIIWKCQCDCKNKTIKYINTGDLKNTKSCGCIISSDLVGQIFGRLTVKQKTDKRCQRKGCIIWKCQCNCPNKTIKYLNTDTLKRTQSCGCIQRELMNSRRGKEHPNWNPNLTEYDREIGRNYPEYRKWVRAVYKRDNYTCQCCSKKKGKGVKLHAHHIRDYATYHELRTQLSNGITLCEKCHNIFHSKYGKGYNNPWQLTRFIRKFSIENSVLNMPESISLRT